VLILKEMTVWANVAVVAPVEPGGVSVWAALRSGWSGRPRDWGKWRVVSGEWRVGRRSRFLSAPGMTIHRSFSRLESGRCGLRGVRCRRRGGLGSRTPTGQSDQVGPPRRKCRGKRRPRKAGQHLVSEFGACGRQRSVWRWGGLRGLGKWRVVSGE